MPVFKVNRQNPCRFLKEIGKAIPILVAMRAHPPVDVEF